jgi:hypothetical protein
VRFVNVCHYYTPVGCRSILNDTLEIEKMSAGAYTLEMAPFHLHSALVRVVQNLEVSSNNG